MVMFHGFYRHPPGNGGRSALLDLRPGAALRLDIRHENVFPSEKYELVNINTSMYGIYRLYGQQYKLVGGFEPLEPSERYESIGMTTFQICGNIKKSLKAPTS